MKGDETARQVILVLFIVIFAVCALILLIGEALAVFFGRPLPEFYNYAFGLVILEPVAFIILWVKNIFGLRNGDSGKIIFPVKDFFVEFFPLRKPKGEINGRIGNFI